MNDDAKQIDCALRLLTSKERRKVIEYFDDNVTDTATVEELSVRLGRLVVEPDGAGERATDAARAELHHVHLPKLEDYGVVEYDRRTGHVRYHPDERVEDIVQFLDEV